MLFPLFSYLFLLQAAKSAEAQCTALSEEIFISDYSRLSCTDVVQPGVPVPVDTTCVIRYCISLESPILSQNWADAKEVNIGAKL
jgi:hypothetical protein